MLEKPFPWKCPQCRELRVIPDTVDYTVTVEQDGHSYAVKVPALHVPRCQNCLKLVMTEAANQQVTKAFRQLAGLLSPEEIRSQRIKLGYQQQKIADLFGVGIATVARWENGAQIQPRSFDRFLRAFFEVPELRQHLEKLQDFQSEEKPQHHDLPTNPMMPAMPLEN